MKDLTFKELQEKNLIRCKSSTGFNHSLDSWQIDQWTNAIAGEVGEACNLAKKISRTQNNIRGNKKYDQNEEFLKAELAGEIADVVIYCSLTAEKLGVDLGNVVRAVFNMKSEEIGSEVKL